jgi:hypothetical protein
MFFQAVGNACQRCRVCEFIVVDQRPERRRRVAQHLCRNGFAEAEQGRTKTG